jgi:signal peptidase I
MNNHTHAVVSKSRALRSRLATVALVLLTVAAWLVLAPTSVGGSTDYVTTHGVSMAPRIHTGDLALVRPAARYRVGEIVAYRSPLLHTVVLHRIVGQAGDHYVLKGDNNNFLDPTHPGRAEIIGKLWLRLPHGGVVLGWLRTPAIAAVLSGGAALLLLLGGGQRRRRRRDRRRPHAAPNHQGDRPMSRPSHPISARQIFIACAIAAGAFMVLGVLALANPTNRAVAVKTPYTEKVSFAYRSTAPAGPVYPNGVVRTGDPVFLRLVHRIHVTVGYRLAATAPHRVSGTLGVGLRVASQTGWTRTLQLAAPRRFAGDHASREVTLDLNHLWSLIGRVQTLTGAPTGGEYSLAVVPRLHLRGTVADQPITSEFAPALGFQLDVLKLLPGSSATTSGNQPGGLTPTRRATVTASTTASNELGVNGHGLPVATARWIAVLGFLLAMAGLVVTRLEEQRRPLDPTARIQARYGHLIVPIGAITPSPARAPIDVTTIDALAQLAERSERLILHHQRDETDTYLVDDEGTLYRYQTRQVAERLALGLEQRSELGAR